MDEHEIGDKIPDPRDKKIIPLITNDKFPEPYESLSQGFKRRLMDELVVGFESEYITELIYGDGQLILKDKEKT